MNQSLAKLAEPACTTPLPLIAHGIQLPSSSTSTNPTISRGSMRSQHAVPHVLAAVVNMSQLDAKLQQEVAAHQGLHVEHEGVDEQSSV